MPVTKNKSAKSYWLYEKIKYAYTKKLQADIAFAGFLIKNPLNPFWNTIVNNRLYELTELADYIDLPNRIPTRKELERFTESRNCDLFDFLREIAYHNVLSFKNKNKTYTEFKEYLFNIAMSFNLNFKDKNSDYYTNKGTLSMSELSTIVNSVSKYSYRNFSIKQFSEIQANRRSKRKQYNKVIDTSNMFFSIDKDNIREYLRKLPSGLFISGVAKSLGISRKTIYRLSKNL